MGIPANVTNAAPLKKRVDDMSVEEIEQRLTSHLSSARVYWTEDELTILLKRHFDQVPNVLVALTNLHKGYRQSTRYYGYQKVVWTRTLRTF